VDYRDSAILAWGTRMDNKPALQSELYRRRDRVFQLRLMVEQARRTSPGQLKELEWRLSAAMDQLNNMTARNPRAPRATIRSDGDQLRGGSS
jgi:hypothetical protein